MPNPRRLFTGSPAFSIAGSDLWAIAKPILYSMGAAAVAGVLNAMGSISPSNLAGAVAMAAAVPVLHFVEKFLTNTTSVK